MEQTPETNEVSVVSVEGEAPSISVEQIHSMIAQLSTTEDGEPLRNAMDDLKKALKQNPVACTLLLPEEIGEMVRVLMQITGREIEEQASGRKKKKEKIDLTDEKVQQEILDDLF